MQDVQMPQDNKRRINRFTLFLPVKVESSVDTKVSWTEITRLHDVSAFGAGFNLKRPVKRGRLLKMTMPLPRQLRVYDFIEPQYQIWGLVRRCVKPEKETGEAEHYALGVAFIGKHPPAGFEENPAKLYDITHHEKGLWEVKDADVGADETHLPQHQRRHSRFSIPLTLQIERIDGEGSITASDYAVTENLSLGGAALITTMDLEIGSFVRVISEQYDAAIISVVRGKRPGANGIPRVHIEFIDQFFPLEGIV